MKKFGNVQPFRAFFIGQLIRDSLAKTATTTTKARRVFITVTRQRAGSIGARPDQYCCAMGGTHLDSGTTGSLHLVDLVRSLVRSEDIFSVEHEADWLPADVGAPEWWADNGCWADSLMQPPKRVCLEERSPKREADDAGSPGPSPLVVPVAPRLEWLGGLGGGGGTRMRAHLVGTGGMRPPEGGD